MNKNNTMSLCVGYRDLADLEIIPKIKKRIRKQSEGLKLWSEW